jgi:hypothetical protein
VNGIEVMRTRSMSTAVGGARCSTARRDRLSTARRDRLTAILRAIAPGLTALRVISAATTLATTLVLCVGTSIAAQAGQRVTLHAGFTPYRLGTRTTIRFGFQVHSTTPGHAPSPVTDLELNLPTGLGLTTSELGLANCEASALLALGPEGCPPNARIGSGSAIVSVPAEGAPVEEEGSLTVVVGRPDSEHLEVLFLAEGRSPISAQLVFPGHLLEDGPPFGDRLDTSIPLIPTWPGGPDVAITRMSATIGPLGLTYYRHVRGRVVAYHPRGIALPRHCPRGGFPFRADISFLDGAHAGATYIVPCPV